MIVIKNWNNYQSYKDRRPPWIRFHRSMLDNYEYQTMSAEARALLPMLWLLACEHNDPTSGIIDQDVKKISFRLRQSVENIEYCLRELQVSDFIECIESVTKPLRECNENVTPETETETETDTEKDSHRANAQSGNGKPLPFTSTEVMNIWNKVMEKTNATKKKIMADETRRRVNLLTKSEFTKTEDWESYFKALTNSDFLMGKVESFGRKPFRLTLEWAIKQQNMIKVLEGNYHG